MEQKAITAPNKSINFLQRTEKFFIATLHIGVLLKFFGIEVANYILMISAAGLAIAFFISAFKPHNMFKTKEEANEHGPLGTLDLISLMIIPKVLWLSAGISTLAMFIFMLKLGNDGYLNLAAAGGAAIIISFLILVIAVMSGVKKLKSIRPLLIRAVPALIVDYFLLF